MTLKLRPLPIQRGDRMFCRKHQAVFVVTVIDHSQEIDACLLECGCSRSRYLEPNGISTEHAWSEKGREHFPADFKADMEEAVFWRYKTTVGETS